VSSGLPTTQKLRHRGHARVEDRIRAARDMRLRNLPFRDIASNEACVELVLAPMDLVAWTKLLCLDGNSDAPNLSAFVTRRCTLQRDL